MPPNGPRHAIMGNDATDYGMGIPQTDQITTDITRESNMARFSKSAEFKALKKTIETRIAYHKQYSPGSKGETAFRDMPNNERGWRSLAADLVIEELNLIINAYETANKVVEDVKKAETVRRQRPKSSTS